MGDTDRYICHHHALTSIESGGINAANSYRIKKTKHQAKINRSPIFTTQVCFSLIASHIIAHVLTQLRVNADCLIFSLEHKSNLSRWIKSNSKEQGPKCVHLQETRHHGQIIPECYCALPETVLKMLPQFVCDICVLNRGANCVPLNSL